MVRWPGQIKPGGVFNDIMRHMDWLPTFAAAAGWAVASMKEDWAVGFPGK